MSWRKFYQSFATTNENFTFLCSLLDNCKTKAEAKTALKGFTGGLSSPSKMPSYSYNIPAWECKVGMKLAKVKGSTCSGCYATKGRYHFSNVKDSMYNRFHKLDGQMWAEAMTLEINIFNRGTKCDSGYFRWHDSGDLQSTGHFANICKIANWLPNVTFWLPTREYKFVSDYKLDIPANLTVRFSAHMNNSYKEVANKAHNSIVIESEDVLDTLDVTANVCHATRPDSSHKCESCRACWNAEVATIAYLKH